MGFVQMLFGDPVSIAINAIIIIAGIIVIFRIFDLKRDMSINASNLTRMYHGKSVRRKMDQDATMRVVSGTNINLDDMNKLRKDYDHICVKYNTVSQLIPVFPSLGILGTVAGLMYQVKAQGIEEMTSSITLALSSTMVALIFTVVLKTYMAVSVSRDLEEINVTYNEYDRYRQDIVDKVKLNED